jgi:hypothetical protein
VNIPFSNVHILPIEMGKFLVACPAGKLKMIGKP